MVLFQIGQSGSSSHILEVFHILWRQFVQLDQSVGKLVWYHGRSIQYSFGGPLLKQCMLAPHSRNFHKFHLTVDHFFELGFIGCSLPVRDHSLIELCLEGLFRRRFDNVAKDVLHQDIQCVDAIARNTKHRFVLVWINAHGPSTNLRQ